MRRSGSYEEWVCLSVDRGLIDALVHAGAGRSSRTVTVALLLEQIAFLQTLAGGGVRRDGKRWTRQTYDGLLRHMPGVKERTLKHALDTARRMGLVHTIRVGNGQLMRVDLAAVVGLGQSRPRRSPQGRVRWDMVIAEIAGRNAAAVLYQSHTWTNSRHAVERVTPERGRELWAKTTVARLADRLGLSERTVSRAIARSEREGLLRKKRQSHGLLLKPDYDAIRERCGEAAPPWAARL